MKKKIVEDEKLNSMAKEYFTDDFSELEPNRINKLKNRVIENKSNKKSFWLKFAYGATALCCIVALCVILPFALRPEELYTYSDLIRHDLTLDYCQEYINENYPKYAFIFDDCNIISHYGQYAEDDLYILELEGTNNNIPYTYLEFTLIVNQDIDYPERNYYVVGAEITQSTDYTLYKKVANNFESQEMYALLDYENYDLYLRFSINDEELLNKFL